MAIHKIKDLLRALGERGIERARPELGQEIKNRIPPRLIAHRMDTINIIVDLRISRMAAAAAIVLALVVIGSLLGGRDAVGRRIYQDGKLFVEYALHGENAGKAQVVDNLSWFRDDLIAQGREVVYYGNQVNLNDPHAIVMHWKIAEDRYGVILGDLSSRTISAKTLIRLQDHMLQERMK